MGARGIGRSAAAYLLESDPSAQVRLYDSDRAKLDRVAGDLATTYGTRRVSSARHSRDILGRRGIIVSAVTSPVVLFGSEDEGLDLDGTFVLDDSEPHAVSREAIEARGGQVAWVIGEDRSECRALTLAGGFEVGPAPRQSFGRYLAARETRYVMLAA
jgi:hypothetical protein